mgnify:CR=1 FL=1
MALVETPWHVLGAFLVFVFGLLLMINVGRRLDLKRPSIILLYCWHTLFCFIYVIYVLKNGGDAVEYYRDALTLRRWELGTAAISGIAAPFIHVIGLSFLGVNLVFSLFGAIGLLAFYASLKAEIRDKPRWVRRLALLVVLLPSVSFWSAALGKDALAFMATGLALWAAINLRDRSLVMWFAVGIMLIIRPHMAGIMILALGVSLTFTSSMSHLRKFAFSTLIILAAAIMIPLALRYAGLGSAESIAEVGDYIEQRQMYNREGGGGIDISSMNAPMRAFTYLFRPLPFEAHNFSALAASMDNVLLLALTGFGIWGLANRRKGLPGANRIFLWCYSAACLGVLSMTTANLGISVRQKWMFLPMIIFLLFSVTGRARRPPLSYGGSSL